MIKRCLVIVGLWLARCGGWVYPEPGVVAVVDRTAGLPRALIERTRVLTASWDTHPAGGAYKRHQVLALLTKEFPTTPKRQLALAIEVVLA